MQRQTHHTKSPVENTNQHLHWSTAERQDVLDQKQPSGQSQVRQQSNQERQSRQGQPNDGEILEMPAIRLISDSQLVSAVFRVVCHSKGVWLALTPDSGYHAYCQEFYISILSPIPTKKKKKKRHTT